MVHIERFWCETGFTYDPEHVKQWLATLDPSPRGDLYENAKRGIISLRTGTADAGIAGGILELLYSPEHACNTVLHAYAKVPK